MTTMYSEIMRLKPLRYYPLADAVASGTATDKSSHAATGTVNGNVTFGQAPLIKASTYPCAIFDGSTGYIIDTPGTGLPTGAAAFSVITWINYSTVQHDSIINFGGGSGFYLFTNLAHTTVYLGGSNHDSGFAPSTGVVYFMAITYDGSTCILYIGDTSSLTTYALGTGITGALSGGSLYISSDPFSNYYAGKQAHVAVFGNTLTTDQAAWLYHVGQGAGVLQGNHQAFGEIR